ncbi:MAG: TonB-dependent receptor [Phocaeicola sp.]
MRDYIKQILLFAFLNLSCLVTFAQTKVSGKVVDAENRQPLFGATVMKDNKLQGTLTNADGEFFLESIELEDLIQIKYLGYKDKEIYIDQEGITDLGIIELEADLKMLGDVIITSSVAIARKTPVATSTVSRATIQEKMGNQEFSEILKSTPGVYATKQGGGYGDSKINMRGFQSANVAVLINGIPMNDMEWGGIYWSNFTGLEDVARTIQTQRGLGAAKVSVPSVGGSISIVTNSYEQKKGGSISYGMSNDNGNLMRISFATGLNEKGWGLTAMLARKWGDGYVQGTEYNDYNYYVNIAKKLGDNHMLSFTGVGSKQEHYQRNNSDGLTLEGWQNVGNYMKNENPLKYNPTYGYGKHGERKTSAYNEYHKPLYSFNWMWQIDSNSSLSTSAYTSFGRGNGYSGQGINATYANGWMGASNGVLNTTYRHADGTFAYDQIQEMNEQSEMGSLMAMSKSINRHNWFGLLSTYTTKLSEYIDFYGGADFRYYKGTLVNELMDLYNGAYYTDQRYRSNVLPANNAAAANPDFVYQQLKVGDVVYRDYDGYILQEGVYAQAEYNRDKISAFVSGSASNSSYWRVDRFYYDKAHGTSETVHFLGYTVKGGVNYNIDESHNLFANLGYISRAPFFSGAAFLQVSTSNEVNKDAVNEKVFSFELGYGYKSSWLSANMNAYYTKWMDKTMTRSSDFDYTDASGNSVRDRLSMNMSGVNALHKGLEIDFVVTPTNWLDLRGAASFGDWRWDSNATGYWYNSAGQPISDLQGGIASGLQSLDHLKATVEQKGNKVGGSAQTTVALGAAVALDKTMCVGVDYNLYARNYSNVNTSTNDFDTTPGDENRISYTNPWRIPTGQQVDLNASYRFHIGSTNATLFGNIYNLFNQTYITDAYVAGSSEGTAQDAYRIFYAFGRTYSVRLNVAF